MARIRNAFLAILVYTFGWIKLLPVEVSLGCFTKAVENSMRSPDVVTYEQTSQQNEISGFTALIR